MRMAHSHQTKSPSPEPLERGLDRLQRFISSNPLVSLVVGAVAVGGVVAGVMNYLANERITNLGIKHDADIAQIKTTDKAELLAVTIPLNQKIEDLNFRLASIERRVPGVGPLYLDITTVTKGADIWKTLSSGRYTSFDHDGFYVAVPPGSWKFEMIDELSHIKSMSTSMNKVWDLPQAKMLAQALEKSTVFLWQGSSKAQLFSGLSGNSQDFTLRPSIWVEHITGDSLKEQIEAAIQIKADLDLKMEDIKQKLSEVTTLLREAAKARQNTEVLKAMEAAEAIKVKSALMESTAKQDKIKILENLASGELTDYVLLNLMGNMISQNATWPLWNHILSMQHKGNVFYIQEQIRFTNVEISINDGERHHADTTSVDQEIFFFNKGKDGYLLTALLPPVPDRADNFAWSNSWLTGLQIPIY